jgi:membrane-associated protease RseP (regulator of RpoE activity)
MVAGDSYIGFLELPGGQQTLVRLGSVVDGGTVVAFERNNLRIRFTDSVLELALEDSGKPPPATPAADVVLAGEETGHLIHRSVDAARLQAELGKAQHSAQPAPPPRGGSGSSAQQTLTQLFAPLLDLPPGARVVQVNEAPVRSADEAIRTVETTLAAGRPARLNLETPSGMKRVYLVPTRPAVRAPPGQR